MSENHLLVYVNGVEIGKIGSAEYAGIRRDAYKNPSLYLVQSANLIYSMLLLAARVMIVIPIYVFWLLAVALTDSSITHQIFAAMNSRILRGQPLFSMFDTKTALTLLFLLYIVTFTVEITINGRVPSFINVFDREINQRVRLLLKQPAYGDVYVVEDYVGNALGKAVQKQKLGGE